MNRIYAALGAVVLVVAGLATTAYLRVTNIPILEPRGPVASGELQVIVTTVLMSSIVIVPVFFLLFYFAWKYRASNPETQIHHRPDWDHSNTYLEFTWWLVPAAIIAVLSVVAWQSSHALDPYVPLRGTNTPMTIQVVALDWKWLFIYPEEGIATVNMVEFPVGSPIHFELTADAPMNSFWIPALAGQIMVMPGMTTQLNVLADRPGVFNGVSGNISGSGFSGMTFVTKAVSADDFARWVEHVRQSSASLTSSAYDELAKPSSYDPMTSYAPVDPGLYTAIIMKFISPNGMSIASTTPIRKTEQTMDAMPGTVLGQSTSTMRVVQ